MRELVDQATAGIRGFWEQRDDLVLVLQAADVDLPPVLKIVEGLEAELAFVWAWVFAQPFVASIAYVDTIVSDIAARRDAVCATLAKDGKPGWPVLPADMTDPAHDAVARLRTAVVYVRELVPVVPGGVTVFGLLPTDIEDPGAYAALCGELVRHQLPFPWCARVRFLLRDYPDLPQLGALLAAPRVRSLRTDFSPPALEAALKKESADPGLPDSRRMMSAVVAAGMAEANGRTPDALVGYMAALEHFGSEGNAAMAALAAHGVASCKQALGDAEAAERIWLAALDTGLAAEPPALPVLLSVLLGLVMLVARQGRWFEAEAYAGATGAIAKVLFMPTVQAEAEERCGIAQLRQGKLPEAEQSWRAAIATADEADDAEHALSARTLLRRLLARQEGREEDARLLSAEIARLEHAPTHTHATAVPA